MTGLEAERLWQGRGTTMWDRGALQNDEIGRVFGVSCLAASHIGKNVKDRMKKDPQLGREVQSINSPSKM